MSGAGRSWQACARRVAWLPALAAALAAACGPARLHGPTRPDEELIVLLPDAETGATGRASVSNPTGSVTLDSAREGILVVAKQPLGPTGRLSQADVDRLFGDALAALPPPVRYFTLNFRFESDELTDRSRALVPEIIKVVKSRPVPDVVVVGHTDTSGAREANIELGMKRAMMVRALLINAGLLASSIEATSHGEADLLIKTADDTFEPRNRRVDIAVR